MSDKQLIKSVTRTFPQSERAAFLGVVATFDLYFGPYPGENNYEGSGQDWPGIERACEELRGSLADVPRIAYYVPDYDSLCFEPPEDGESDYYEVDPWAVLYPRLVREGVL